MNVPFLGGTSLLYNRQENVAQLNILMLYCIFLLVCINFKNAVLNECISINVCILEALNCDEHSDASELLACYWCILSV